MITMIRVFILATVLTSCNSLPTLSIIKDSKNILFGYPALEVTKSLYESYEYSFATLRIGNGPESIIILKEYDKGLATWVSEDNIQITSLDGLIIETSGLEHDYKLINTDNKRTTVLYKNPDRIFFQNITNIEESLKEYSIFDEDYVSDVIEKKVLIENKGLRSFVDTFIIYDNKVVKATQQLHPFYDKFEIRYFYKY